jgi:hypothetical protein
MAYPLFTRVALQEDFPEYRLCRGDVATIVDVHEAEDGEEVGYSLEVFNAIGETIAVLVVEESKIEPLRRNEIFHIRQIDEAAVAL